MLVNQHQLGVEQLIRRELGLKIDKVPFEDVPNFEDFFTQCEPCDLLDSITLVYRYMKQDQSLADSFHEHWATEAGRILTEENMAYRAGTDAIVHPFVDEEFEVNRASALEVLSDPRFGEARTDFEAAYRQLRDGNGKEALRMMFPAVEVAAKVLFRSAFARLMPNEVDRHLKPAIEQRYAGNEPAIAAGRLLLDGMKNWIAAAQLYRHGQEQEQPADPPTDFVIAHLSAGAIYLRWMIEFCSDREEQT
jgi:hypothetical protein